LPRSTDDAARGPLQVPKISDLAFVGREREMGHLHTIFSEHPGRLVTVVGAGGLGKTRFACELAVDLANLYPGGCYFVGLSDQDSGEGIATQLADALGERLANEGNPRILIAERLTHRPPTLFILDNFEHLTAHAESTVGLWHRSAPRAGWLVTSRAVLGLDDEFCFQLGPLPLPEVDGDPASPEALTRLGSNPAVHLFVERARRRRLDFSDGLGDVLPTLGNSFPYCGKRRCGAFAENRGDQADGLAVRSECFLSEKVQSGRFLVYCCLESSLRRRQLDRQRLHRLPFHEFGRAIRHAHVAFQAADHVAPVVIELEVSAGNDQGGLQQ
jgi:hypothetical protein